jgi:hypothetical protein
MKGGLPMLTVLGIEKLKPKEKSYKVSDGNGLYILIEPAGGKLWRIRYKFDGKEKMLSLGSFPEVSLASARTRCDDARKLIAEGKDPSQQRKLDKITARYAIVHLDEADHVSSIRVARRFRSAVLANGDCLRKLYHLRGRSGSCSRISSALRSCSRRPSVWSWPWSGGFGIENEK